MSTSRLFQKRADILNEELGKNTGTDREHTKEYDNPFCNKRTEENMTKEVMSSGGIESRGETKILPPRERRHLDKEVETELEEEREVGMEAPNKTAAALNIDALEVARKMNANDVKILKIIARKPGQDIMDFLPSAGGQFNKSLRYIQQKASEGWFALEGTKVRPTEVTMKLIEAYEAGKHRVAASLKSALLQEPGSSSSNPGPRRDNRELGREGKFQLGESKFIPKVGDDIDFYDLSGDKQYGSVQRISPTSITILDHSSKKRNTFSLYYCSPEKRQPVQSRKVEEVERY
jgi:hypothetical protein